MDEKLRRYLNKYNIQYKSYEHPAVFTVSQSSSIKIEIPGKHTKCLFLKDEKGSFYLIVLLAEKRLNTRLMKEKLGAKELHFASIEELKKELNLTPGSVSLFGMIYAKNTCLIIDKELWDAESAGFHPNINTSTLVLNHENIEKFYNSISAQKKILKL